MTFSVSELEQKALRGETVTPEQLGAAELAQDAAVKLARLGQKRAEILDVEARHKIAAEAQEELMPKLKAFAEDTRLAKIREELKKLTVECRELAAARNEQIAAFRGEIMRLHTEAPRFAWQFSAPNDGSGEFFIGSDRVPRESDWFGTLKRDLDEAAISAQQAA